MNVYKTRRLLEAALLAIRSAESILAQVDPRIPVGDLGTLSREVNQSLIQLSSNWYMVAKIEADESEPHAPDTIIGFVPASGPEEAIASVVYQSSTPIAELDMSNYRATLTPQQAVDMDLALL